MAKKNTTTDGDKQVPATTEQNDARPGSRHKPRKMLSVSPRDYELLSQLAARKGRPVAWQHRIIVQQALVDAGLLDPKDAAFLEPDED